MDNDDQKITQLPGNPEPNIHLSLISFYHLSVIIFSLETVPCTLIYILPGYCIFSLLVSAKF